MKHLYCLIPAVLFAAPAGAEQSRDEIPNITVTAEPFKDRSPVEATHPTSVLSGDELDRNRRGTLGATLANEPGVHSADFAAGASRPVIRGLGGPRVRVLEDGVGVYDASIVSPDHNVSTEPFRARQIEVLKGPATLLYGSGAIGGVINVVSDLVPDKASEGLEGSIGTRFTSVDSSESLHGHLGGGRGGFAFHLDGLTRNTEDYDVPGFADIDGPEEEDAVRGVVENSFVESDSYGLGLSWTGRSGYIGLGFSGYDTRYGIPGHGHGHAEEGEEEGEAHGEEAGPFIDLQQTRVLLRGEWNAPFGIFERLRAALTNSAYEHAEIEAEEEHADEAGGEEEEEHHGTVFSNDATELRLELTHKPLAGLRGVVGVQISEQEFFAEGEESFVPPVDTASLGLFLLEERDFASGRISAGLRVESVEHDPSAGPTLDFSLLSASLGLHLDLTADKHLRLGLSHSERAPDVQELYSNGPHLATTTFELGNPELDAESALNLDAGFHGETGPLSYAVNLFFTQYGDFIFQTEVDEDGTPGPDFVDEAGDPADDDELLLIRYAQQDADFWGLEAELSYGLIDETSRKLALRLFGDLVQAELDDGSDLPRISPMRLGLGLEGRSGPWRYGADLTQVFEQDDVAALETATDGYLLLGTDLGYVRGLGNGLVSVYLRGRNLLDEEARNHVSFLKDVAPQPGASATLELGYEY